MKSQKELYSVFAVKGMLKLYKRFSHLKDCKFFTDNWKAFSKIPARSLKQEMMLEGLQEEVRLYLIY